jgi:hypothetical protein
LPIKINFGCTGLKILSDAFDYGSNSATIFNGQKVDGKICYMREQLHANAEANNLTPSSFCVDLVCEYQSGGG